MSLAKQLATTQKKVNKMIDQILSEKSKPEILYKASRHIIEAGGKRLRPFLALKSCEIVGGKEEDALPMAAAVELLHNFTLIHDDIMDQSKMRRGVPAVHVVWGVPIAIDAGDLVFAKVYEAAINRTNRKRVSNDRILNALTIITNAAITVCEGQIYDISFEKKGTVTEEEYFNMIRWKTAALYKAAAEVGATIGGGTKDQVKRLGAFAYNAGAAFQIKDDVLGLIGKESIIKKPVGDDIRQGKRTLLIAYAIKHANAAQRRKILATLGNGKASPKQIREVIEIISSLGAIEYANRKADDFIRKAKKQLDPFFSSSARRTLLDLARFFVTRKY